MPGTPPPRSRSDGEGAGGGVRLLVASVAFHALACATVPAVERYPLKAPPDRALAAMNEVASRLQWVRQESPTLKPGQLQFLALPDRIVASVEAGELVLEGPVRWTRTVNGEVRRYPGYMAQILEQATDQVIDPAVVKPGAREVAPRSRPLALALDVIEPAIGAAYAVPGDPYMEGEGYGWVGIIAIRGLVDVAGAGALIYGVARSQPLIAPTVVGIVVLAASRLLFSAVDWFVTGKRNVVAESGFKLLLKPPE